ncbi:hypothetical protein IWX91DRAFT_344329 [Phyllosticta citricarpa]
MAALAPLSSFLCSVHPSFNTSFPCTRAVVYHIASWHLAFASALAPNIRIRIRIRIGIPLGVHSLIHFTFRISIMSCCSALNTGNT